MCRCVTDPACAPLSMAFLAVGAAAPAASTARGSTSSRPQAQRAPQRWEVPLLASAPPRTLSPPHPDGAAAPQAHPDVPLVEQLTDLWKVSRLQAERNARQQQRERGAGAGGGLACGGDDGAEPAELGLHELD